LSAFHLRHEAPLSFSKTIFGGSNSKSESGNKAYPWVSQTFEPGSGQRFQRRAGGIEGLWA
jgi:hypothetical protein